MLAEKGGTACGACTDCLSRQLGGHNTMSTQACMDAVLGGDSGVRGECGVTAQPNLYVRDAMHPFSCCGGVEVQHDMLLGMVDNVVELHCLQNWVLNGISPSSRGVLGPLFRLTPVA